MRLPFFYGWVVVAVTFVTMAIGVNARTAFSLFFPPIISSIVTLARGLDMSVTAEGVETREEYERLKALGVNFAQGYLFGRPHAIERIVFDAPVKPSQRDAA
jgi:EAL domain-containing protein (putative c-di-GMP-specific phosphodiesterase class I)